MIWESRPIENARRLFLSESLDLSDGASAFLHHIVAPPLVRRIVDVMTNKLIFWTLDWVPAGDAPRGFVRDLRLRWAAEEAEQDEQDQSGPARHVRLHRARRRVVVTPLLIGITARFLAD